MSRKRLKQYILIIAAIFVALIYQVSDNLSVTSAQEQGGGKSVYVIPIEREVERGLEAFLKRTTSEAVEAGADHIIFEIDTPGGRVDAAGQIGQIIQGLPIPTTAFIVNEALSAGSYIALFSETIYFKPHATMGASGVITADGTAADEKAQSAWFAAMKSAAESTGRDPLYALAMADSSIDLPEYGAPEGRFLTLGPSDAVEVGYADGIVDDRVELLYELGLSNASIIETEPSAAEEVARFLTNPIVIPILLSVASLGLIVELYSPGFGVPGIMGIVSLLLFFYGHIVAGLAGMEAVVLLVLGIILIIAEFFVPGGILGLLGVGAIIGSLFMSGYDLGHMSMSIGIAFLVTLIVAVILFRRIGMDKGVFRHIILRDSTATEQGYVSSVNRLELIGMEGITLTPLRPSGIGEFDGERIDIVSEGSFIDRNKSVKVVRVEGVRVVVREV
ncbi:membrane-bound serine protease (ClpP class) [Oceanobacillus polygoni]|uniref:Membrane-bound serine protease (ClpP class) n=2 Tax=Oceanobacillus polygoni TaxID=1235259 RepID=A0A9X0YSY0_9BACI|nr:nodulation protein NfeD [Oceanobacillus polygoni]MBP2078153.1 membrane-bound serine protease (ClpP class) [Oceanobacillus polygoni]